MDIDGNVSITVNGDLEDNSMVISMSPSRKNKVKGGGHDTEDEEEVETMLSKRSKNIKNNSAHETIKFRLDSISPSCMDEDSTTLTPSLVFLNTCNDVHTTNKLVHGEASNSMLGSVGVVGEASDNSMLSTQGIYLDETIKPDPDHEDLPDLHDTSTSHVVRDQQISITSSPPLTQPIPRKRFIYILPDQQISITSSPPGPMQARKRGIWLRVSTMYLIEQVKKNYAFLKDPALKKKQIWRSIAENLRIKIGGTLTAGHAECKWKNMVRSARRFTNVQRTQGRWKMKKTEFHDAVMEIISVDCTSEWMDYFDTDSQLNSISLPNMDEDSTILTRPLNTFGQSDDCKASNSMLNSVSVVEGASDKSMLSTPEIYFNEAVKTEQDHQVLPDLHETSTYTLCKEKRRDVWSVESTKYLIEQVNENYALLRDPLKKKKTVWLSIAANFKSKTDNPTAEQMQMKWKNLVKTVRKFNENRRTPYKCKMKKIEFHDAIMGILKNSPSVDSHFVEPHFVDPQFLACSMDLNEPDLPSSDHSRSLSTSPDTSWHSNASIFRPAITYKSAVVAETSAAAVIGTSIALINGPSAAPVNGPSVAPVNGTSAAPVNGPSAAPVNGPSAAPVNGPSAAPVNGTSAAPVNGTSAAPVYGTSAALVNRPSAAAVNSPSAAAINGPSAAAVNGPFAAPVNGPSMASVNGLSAAPILVPLIVHVAGPSTPTFNKPSTIPVVGPYITTVVGTSTTPHPKTTSVAVGTSMTPRLMSASVNKAVRGGRKPRSSSSRSRGRGNYLEVLMDEIKNQTDQLIELQEKQLEDNQRRTELFAQFLMRASRKD